ncbi:MAG: hypothetical protein HQ517_02030, partial [SAR324 cluster bacterium]|nr:hypothetical protein [SAR324 cluster bacterium]
MKKRALFIGISLSILFLVPFFSLSILAAKKPVKVVFMTSPMGTAAYNIGAAFEQVFQKAGSWVQIKHQETPGGMYMYRYIATNREKMISGEIPHTVAASGVAAIAHLAEGRWPFKKFSWPTTKALISTGLMASLYGVYDEDIKSLADFSGKRVCTYERARVFFGLLSDKPLFGKGVGIFEEIDWAPLGLAGCKDAFMNGKVDVMPLTFRGSVE